MDLISILLTGTVCFYADYKLKDKMWKQMILLLEKCHALPVPTIQRICKLPIVEKMFNGEEQQSNEEVSEVTFVQNRVTKNTNEFAPENFFKLAFTQQSKILPKFLKFTNKKKCNLLVVELLYKFYSLAQKTEAHYFFNNNTTSYLRMHGRLISEPIDG